MGVQASFDALRGRLLVALAIAAGTTLAASAPASATIYERFEYEGTDQDDFELCGLDVHFELEFSGRVQIREGKNKDAGAFFLQDNYSSLETITNPDNGRYFTISHEGVFQDLKATRVEGSIFEFVSHDVGQPFVVRDVDGRVVLRDRGAITSTYLFDTFGDDMPGGQFVAELDVRVSGPHPAFFIAPGEECLIVSDLIG